MRVVGPLFNRNEMAVLRNESEYGKLGIKIHKKKKNGQKENIVIR